MATLTTLAALPGAFAQTPAPAPIGPEKTFFYSSGSPGAENTFHYVTSGIRIEGGVVKNAPYSGQATTETTQQLSDGNRISRKTTSNLYRDSEGRTRREETLGVMGAASSGEPIQTVFINDPVAQTSMVLDSRSKTIHKMPNMQILTPPPPGSPGAFGATGSAAGGVMAAAISAAPLGAVTMSTDMPVMKATAEMNHLMIQKGVSPEGDKNVQKESLGTQMIEGVQAEGTRSTMTIPAGAIGNDLPIKIVSERWYSPELQTVVMSKHSDPRMGDTVYKLTGINRGDPPRALFEAPSDYTVASDEKRADEKRFMMKGKQ
jgi:hypothetical protein